MLPFGRRERKHRDVAIEARPQWLQLLRHGTEERRARLRLRQASIKPMPPIHARLTGDDVLHGLLRLDPGPAAAGPAGTGVQRDLEAQTLRFGHRVLEQGPPRLAHEFDRSRWDA